MLQSKLLLAACASMLLFSSCVKTEDCDGTATKVYDVSDFTKVSASSIMDVSIEKGATFSVRAEGCSRDIEDLSVRVRAGQNLELDFDRNIKRRDRVYINITMPEIRSLDLSGAADANVDGFAGSNHNLDVLLSGASNALIEGTTTQTSFNLLGASSLRLIGATAKLIGNVSGGSELEAFAAVADDVHVEASGGAKAFVRAEQKLTAKASGGSKIVYLGNPTTKDFSTSGGGEIVHQ